MKSVCKGCKYYNACGEPRRTQECKGKELKLDIQLFGGRGQSSSNSKSINTSTKLNDKTKSILKEWEKNKVASAESERQFREEINKMDYEEILKLAQRIDETDLARTTSNASFSLNTALDNIIKVGRRKNANKWSTDYGKWRK